MLRYARYKDTHVGDLLRAEHGFNCLECGGVYRVEKDDEEGLFLQCERGRHYLCEHCNAMDEIIGLYHTPGYN